MSFYELFCVLAISNATSWILAVGLKNLVIKIMEIKNK